MKARRQPALYTSLEQLVDEALATVAIDFDRARVRDVVVRRIRESAAAQRVVGHLGPLANCRLIRFHGVPGGEQDDTLTAAVVLAGGPAS